MGKVKNVQGIVLGILLLYLLMLPLVVGAAQMGNEVGLVIEKTVYTPGEQIQVKFQAPGHWPQNAWIGIVPSKIQHGSEAVNDQHDITYQYIEHRTDGVMLFTAPEPGQWDLRMHDTDNDGREVACISFIVSYNSPSVTTPSATNPIVITTGGANAKLWLEKTVFHSGEQIQLKFQAPGHWPQDAWIGIIPSSIQHGSEDVNDQHDITYQYIEQRTGGVMVFTAPEPGQWDLRMHDTDSNGREVTYISFTVIK